MHIYDREVAEWKYGTAWDKGKEKEGPKLKGSTSCSMSEIADLGYGEKDGKVLMKKFVALFIGQGMSLTDKKYTKTITSFTPMITFAGVVEGPRNAGGKSSPSSPFNGVTFAAYIKSEGLGDVATVNPMPNVYHGNDRKTQAWVWAPDLEAIEKWAKREGLL